jgi:hypothetical protein
MSARAREPLAQLVDHHPPAELGESLVDVVRDGKAHGGTGEARAILTQPVGLREARARCLRNAIMAPLL